MSTEPQKSEPNNLEWLTSLMNQKGAKEHILLGTYDDKPTKLTDEQILKGLEKIDKWFKLAITSKINEIETRARIHERSLELIAVEGTQKLNGTDATVKLSTLKQQHENRIAELRKRKDEVLK